MVVVVERPEPSDVEVQIARAVEKRVAKAPGVELEGPEVADDRAAVNALWRRLGGRVPAREKSP